MSDYKVGDTVRYTCTFKVASVQNSWLDGLEVATDKWVSFMDAGTQHSRLELVDRPKKQPVAGDKLTGDEVVAIRWKQGALLYDEKDADHLLFVQEERWYSTDGGSYATRDIQFSGPYVVLYLPGESSE